MKILFISHSYPPYSSGGTEIYCQSLARDMSLRHQVTVFFRVNLRGSDEYELRSATDGAIKLYSINRTFDNCGSFRGLFEDKQVDKIFAEVLDKVRPDAVFIHHLIFLSMGMVKEVKNRGIPVIFMLHDYWLLCHRCNFLKENMSVCAKRGVDECFQCLRLQLGIKKRTLSTYNFLRRYNSKLAQFIKHGYLITLGQIVGSSRRSKKELMYRFDSVRQLFNDIDIFIAPSQFIRNMFVESGLSASKVINLSYGINLGKEKISLSSKNRKEVNTFAPPCGGAQYSAHELKPKELHFGYIGTILPHKGIDRLIEVFRKISDQHIRLFIYGKIMPYAGFETYDKKIEKLARGDERISFMGSFEHDELKSILSNIDALIVPSVWPENSPFVIHEALACGITVIASRMGGIPELVDDVRNGLLFDYNDKGSLKQKIEFFIHNRDSFKFKDGQNVKVKSLEAAVEEIEGILGVKYEITQQSA